VDPERLLALLEETARKAGVTVRYEDLDRFDAPACDGLCVLGGRLVLFIHKRHAPRKKAEILAQALRRADLGGIYLKPAVRAFLFGEED
jgi:hypothetical protein